MEYSNIDENFFLPPKMLVKVLSYDKREDTLLVQQIETRDGFFTVPQKLRRCKYTHTLKIADKNVDNKRFIMNTVRYVFTQFPLSRADALQIDSAVGYGFSNINVVLNNQMGTHYPSGNLYKGLTRMSDLKYIATLFPIKKEDCNIHPDCKQFLDKFAQLSIRPSLSTLKIYECDYTAPKYVSPSFEYLKWCLQNGKSDFSSLHSATVTFNSNNLVAFDQYQKFSGTSSIQSDSENPIHILSLPSSNNFQNVPLNTFCIDSAHANDVDTENPPIEDSSYDSYIPYSPNNFSIIQTSVTSKSKNTNILKDATASRYIHTRLMFKFILQLICYI